MQKHLLLGDEARRIVENQTAMSTEEAMRVVARGMANSKGVTITVTGNIPEGLMENLRK